MRYLNKIVFLNSAHVPYAEIKLDGNVHFIGTQGVGKSTLLRAILFFYNADKLHLGIPKEKKNFDAFYLPYANSYIVYEVLRENGAYSILVTKSMGRAAFRFIDAPYDKEWLVNSDHEVLADWNEVSKRIPKGIHVSSLRTEYYEFRDIIFGNNRNPNLLPFRKYAIVESSRYQNIPLTIQNVFLNSKLDADFIKNTIIQSMNEDDQSIDLSYYRVQIETFEQEYKDVMLWVNPNKNGVVVVRKQADDVIRHYRSLLYQRKQVDESRAKLNYAEKMARKQLPVLEEQIHEAEANVSRFRRLLDEEKDKHNREREKLVGLIATLSDKIKEVGRKRNFYELQNIQEVIGRVAQEQSCLNEYNTLQTTVDELTSTQKDVIQKYRSLVEQLDNGGKKYENEKAALIVDLKAALSQQKLKISDDCREREKQIRKRLEDKKNLLNDNLLTFTQDVGLLQQRKVQVRCQTHFQKEIDECRMALSDLEKEENKEQVAIEQDKISCEKLRAKYNSEIEKLEWEFQKKNETLRLERISIKEEMDKLQQQLEAWKGSFYEWLEKNRPGWKLHIGKVVDESQILFNRDLNPSKVSDTDQTLFGVRIDLNKIDHEPRSLEQMKQNLQHLMEKDDLLAREQRQLEATLSAQVEAIRKKGNKEVREITEHLHLLEAQQAQIPSKKKKWQIDLETWQRKEEEWKNSQLGSLDLKIGELSQQQEQVREQMAQVAAEEEKQLKRLEEERRKQFRHEEQICDEGIRKIEEEIKSHQQELEHKKRELDEAQTRELSGKGVDMQVIHDYQQQIERVKRELEYIRQKRSLVIEYEKDKREYFDQEQHFRFEKKENDAALEALDEKYKLRNGRYQKNLLAAQENLQQYTQERLTLQKDLERLGSFRSDTILCPPESFTAEEKASTQSCGAIIEELTSMIVSIQKDMELFKRSVNAFNGNFGSRNTFSFPTALTTVTDFYDYASNLCEFVEDNKIEEYQTRISERYTNIIRRISKEVGDMTQNESEIHRTIKAINNDFVQRNFAGVIRSIELRALASNDKLMLLLLEIKSFNDTNEFNMGTLDLFSQASRRDVNEKAVRYLNSFSKMLQDNPSRKSLVLSDTFNLEFRIVENDNDTGWVEKIANVGSDGTDILVKAMVNIMLINVFKEKASRKFGDFKIHCMMDEIGKLHPNNVKGILDFANCRNILLINSSPTTYNVEDYRYTYLLSKDARSNTRVVPLLTRK